MRGMLEVGLVFRRAPRWDALPTVATDEPWDDVEQGWCGWVKREADDVYVAWGDFDELLEISDDSTPELSRPGVVTVDGAEIEWNVVPHDRYDNAWQDAVASCRAGRSSPAGEWVSGLHDDRRP